MLPAALLSDQRDSFTKLFYLIFFFFFGEKGVCFLVQTDFRLVISPASAFCVC